MSEIRLNRINSEMQKCIAKIFSDGIRDVSLQCMVSVMSVKVVNDLKHAAVKLSLYGPQEHKKADFEKICNAKGYIRKELAGMLKSMRFLPDIHFELDDSLEYSEKINKIINELKSDKPAETDSD